MTGLQNCYKRGADAEFLKKGPSLAFKREGWSPVLGPLLKSLHQGLKGRGSSPPGPHWVPYCKISPPEPPPPPASGFYH